MKTTITINGNTIECEESFALQLIAQMCGNAVPATVSTPVPAPANTTSTPAKKPVTPRKSCKNAPLTLVTRSWWDDFKSPTTEVTLTKTTVQVKVKRGHASKWHDTLRHEGFKWSKKGFWWAPLDDKKRAATAERNRSNDAATAGMTKEERREYWHQRSVARAS